MVYNKTHPLYAIVPAAGIGSRMKAELPKQYLKIGEKTILEHTVDKLLSHPLIDKVIIAVSELDSYFENLPLAHNENVIRVVGGGERANSVLSALHHLSVEMNAPESWVLVHDAARPCVRIEDIDNLIEQAIASGLGGILAAPVRDTMKRSGNEKTIHETVCRDNLWHALTPQMFKVKALLTALSGAIEAGVNITDEASAMEWVGESPRLVEGTSDNLKITRPEDLALATFYLAQEKRNTK